MGVSVSCYEFINIICIVEHISQGQFVISVSLSCLKVSLYRSHAHGSTNVYRLNTLSFFGTNKNLDLLHQSEPKPLGTLSPIISS
jgi:hypothetical protein